MREGTGQLATLLVPFSFPFQSACPVSYKPTESSISESRMHPGHSNFVDAGCAGKRSKVQRTAVHCHTPGRGYGKVGVDGWSIGVGMFNSAIMISSWFSSCMGIGVSNNAANKTLSFAVFMSA